MAGLGCQLDYSGNLKLKSNLLVTPLRDFFQSGFFCVVLAVLELARVLVLKAYTIKA